MKHIIGFSGGAASAVCAKIINDKHDNVILLFHDTKSEPDDNERFRREVAAMLKLPITDDSDGRNIWQIFEDSGFLGNGRNTMCSRILKQERSMKFLKKNAPAILYIGYTVEEWRRAQRLSGTYAREGIEVKFPLLEGKIGKKECLHRVENCWGIKLPKSYDFLEHANCRPCIKGSLAYWGLMYKFDRPAWEKTSEMEKKFKHTLFTRYGSLEDELERCLKLADIYLKKRKSDRDQMDLFEFPCECAF